MGIASRVFVGKLIAKYGPPWTASQEAVSEYHGRAIKGSRLGQDSQVRRVLKRFALAAMAGELRPAFRLTAWEKGKAMNASQGCCNWNRERRCLPRQKPIAAALDAGQKNT